MARRRFDLDPEQSRVWIEGTSSIHPIHASANGLEGWIELEVDEHGVADQPAVQGEVRIEVDRLKSGNPLVDAETRRRIDAGRYPEITGIVRRSTRLKAARVALQGEITFRGETQTVDGELHAVVEGDTVELSGAIELDVRAWGLQPPKIGLLKVHPDVTVRLQATAIARPD